MLFNKTIQDKVQIFNSIIITLATISVKIKLLSYLGARYSSVVRAFEGSVLFNDALNTFSYSYMALHIW